MSDSLERRTEPGPCYGPSCDHVSHRPGPRCPLSPDAECPYWAGPCVVSMGRDCPEVWLGVREDDGPTKAEAEDHRNAAEWAAYDALLQHRYEPET